MKVADTTLCEGGQYWGLLRIDNLNRQCVRVLAQHSRTGEWKPVAEFIVINGKLAFTVYGESQQTGTKGVIEGGDANNASADSTKGRDEGERANKIITP
jgi:hypothetical protein